MGSNHGQKASRALDYWKVMRTLQEKMSKRFVLVCIRIILMRWRTGFFSCMVKNITFFKAGSVNTRRSLKRLQEILWKNGKQYFKLLKDARYVAGVCDGFVHASSIMFWVHGFKYEIEASRLDQASLLKSWAKANDVYEAEYLHLTFSGVDLKNHLGGTKWNILQRTRRYHDKSNINVTLRQLGVPLTDV